MNKSAIQKFAIQARIDLKEQVAQRCYQYGITKEGYGVENAETVMGRALTPVEQEQRWQLIQEIKKKGYDQIIEEVAYTWFNRFIALRYMEVNNYLRPCRVFSDSSGSFKPEILSDVIHLDLPGLDMDKVMEFVDKNQTEELYRYLLLTQCNALNESLPRMFEKMGGFTELLLPNNILRPDSVLGRMVSDIPEEDWTDQVQIIGWLYQYYNAELKDETFALLKKNVKITKERIPSATQLFTPDWIVRYMVENSLGRIFIDKRKNEGIYADGRAPEEMTWEEAEAKRVANEEHIAGEMGWKYYLAEAEQTEGVRKQLDEIQKEYADLQPQDIKVIDPCMGSGHILVYAFDVLVQIYKASGYSERDAAKLILEHNLYGLDIDDRAAQLAYFAVMMKARQYDRRIFSRGVQPNVFAIQESNNINRRHLKFFGWQMSDLERNLALNQLNAVLDEFNDAKEYGSILNISKQDWELLYRFVLSVDYSGQMTLEAMGLEDTRDQLLEQVKIAVVMAQKYDVVVTNPPYLSNANMSSRLSEFVKATYPDTKSDLCTCFIEKSLKSLKINGMSSMITMESWMSLSSYKNMRTLLLDNKTIVTMVHMPYLGKGGTSLGINFGTAATIIRNRQMKEYTAIFDRVVYTDCDENGVPFTFPVKDEYYNITKTEYFNTIPGSPLTAYYATDAVFGAFAKGKYISDIAIPASGTSTGDNDKYLRLWHEVPRANINLSARNGEIPEGRWFPCNKGGAYRRWAGGAEYVIDWENDGYRVKNCPKAFLRNVGSIFKPGLTWSKLGSGAFSIRAFPSGFICESIGCCLFEKEENLNLVLALMNSCVAAKLLSIINPSMGRQPGYIGAVPYIMPNSQREAVEILSNTNVNLSVKDWDAFETSWDFNCHPLINMIAKGGSFFDIGRISLAECYMLWESECAERFNQLKANEEELNRIFIDIYGLQDELTPGVEDKDVTVRKADLGRDIRSLISYAVGCMFGRYSLNVPGLTYAGGQWDASKYSTIIPEPDNIIPICDDDYFDDDITARFINWVETVYGKDTLEENLKFIANALGGKGTPREVIRNYFLNDFYADHLKVYQKRPIYWLFDSGKKNGFKALIYMHRYQSDLLARMRTDYVHEMQERYRTQLQNLSEAITTASGAQKVKLTKQQKKVQEQALEIQQYEEKIHHLADQNIKIDLDDGVKHNYALFGDVLAKIK